ncbi:MAG: RDD family protein [Saprospiraceae bacterium]|nr:RDD family protein [Saprospiraceae bacterium]
MIKTIDITTTQNVTIEYQLASLRERMLAWLLDMFIVVFGYILLYQLSRLIFKDLWDWGWSVFWAVMPFMIYFLYHIFLEILNGGQTPGKMALNIRVVRLDGKDPEWSDVVLRSVLQLVDSIFCLGIIGSLLIKTTAKCQRLGDMAANTTVIKIQQDAWRFRLEDILSISTLNNYEPTYPQVRHLNEKDMIFVKTVLARYQRYPNPAHEEVIEDLVSHLMPILQIHDRPLNRIEFLKTLLKDYIVLTR